MLRSSDTPDEQTCISTVLLPVDARHEHSINNFASCQFASCRWVNSLSSQVLAFACFVLAKFQPRARVACPAEANTQSHISCKVLVPQPSWRTLSARHPSKNPDQLRQGHIGISFPSYTLVLLHPAVDRISNGGSRTMSESLHALQLKGGLPPVEGRRCAT